MDYNKYVKYWLIAGCVLLYFQIIIGGITRITGSGLSITKWEIVTGTLPPLNAEDWKSEFELYKQTPQFTKINSEMDLGKFKFIYFWEYFHRLWARIMAIVFLIPLGYFLWRKWIDKDLLRRLGYVFFSAFLAAIFGWIMVASGLVNRPWVNAYKLSLHLGIALMTFGFLLWTVFHVFLKGKFDLDNEYFKKTSRYLFLVVCLQIFFGAILSGMRASLYYPSWPDLNGSFIPDVLLDSSSWSLQNIIDYDKDVLMPALIHVLHRNLGYLVYVFGIYFAIKILRYPLRKIFYKLSISLIVLLNVQVLLGILVLINSKAAIPVFFGVMHQSIAIFIFSIVLFKLFLFQGIKKN